MVNRSPLISMHLYKSSDFVELGALSCYHVYHFRRSFHNIKDVISTGQSVYSALDDDQKSMYKQLYISSEV